MLTVGRDDDGVTLTLARSNRGNALGADLVEALHAALDDIERAPAPARVVIAAEGPHFCTGLDLSDLAHSSDGDLLLRLVRIETLLARLWHAPWHTVALARGRCWGAGADLFAVCEERIAAPDTSFRFPGARFGLVLGTRRLVERVGVDAARRVVTAGEEWSAATALAHGLVSRIDDAAPAIACVVDRETAAALRAATRPDHRDTDLAALVRSAARPGLRGRIEHYLAQLRATKS